MEVGTKLRILYLYQHLLRYSDADHPISTGQLIEILKTQYHVDVNRNTLANDIAMLQKSGVDIEVVHSQSNSYYIDTQTFDIPELKILLDAVSSSKFITKKKSEETQRLGTSTELRPAVRLVKAMNTVVWSLSKKERPSRLLPHSVSMNTRMLAAMTMRVPKVAMRVWSDILRNFLALKS